MSITYKDADGIQGMRTACRLASEVLDHLTPLIQPGLTTREIDRLAADYMKQQGSTSATLGYQIDSKQRVSAGAHVRENAYAAQATKSLLMQYEMAF
jgi:methionine aminopeptidase